MSLNKYKISEMIFKSDVISKLDFIKSLCKDKIVLDIGCIRHKASFAITDPSWLHKHIKNVATSVVGIDYLQEDVEILNKAGFNIIYGDATLPLKNLNQKFDVIVAGDLIEHLANFEGFILNCKELLSENGIIIISTPNPFFSGLNHYIALKKNYVVNPEHTCWIDPMTLAQLMARYGISIAELHFIKDAWKLKDLICESKNHSFNILEGKWENDSTVFKIIRRLTGLFFGPAYALFKFITFTNTKHCRYSDYLAVLKSESDLASCS